MYFLWIFLCKHVILQKRKPIDLHRFIFFPWLFSFQLCLFFHKMRSNCSQVFLKIGLLKSFAIFTAKHKVWCLLIKFHIWWCAKRLQYKSFPVNIAKFLRTPFLKKTSGGCFCKMMKFYKDISQLFVSQIDVKYVVKTIAWIEVSSIYWMDIFEPMC